MIELSQNEIVDLIVEMLKEHAGQIKRGTYNKQDPTAYERFTATLGLGIGFKEERCEDTRQLYPIPENVQVDVNDVCWGVQFDIKTSVGNESGYWSRPDQWNKGEWCNCSPNFHKVLKQIWMEGQEESFWENEVEDNYMTNPNANE